MHFKGVLIDLGGGDGVVIVNEFCLDGQKLKLIQ